MHSIKVPVLPIFPVDPGSPLEPGKPVAPRSPLRPGGPARLMKKKVVNTVWGVLQMNMK